MRKIKYKEYCEEDLKAILPHLREDPMRITLTEHFLDKIGHRNISEIRITDYLEHVKPEAIEKIPDSRHLFELRFQGDLTVVLEIFPRFSVILITAFIEKGAGGVEYGQN